MRILFCTNTVFLRGGMEQITIVKANYFSDVFGWDVGIAFSDRMRGDPMRPISSKIKLYDLEVNYWGEGNIYGKKEYFGKLIKHRRMLQNVVDDFHPSIIISCGMSEKILIPFLRGKHKKIREVHFLSSHREYTMCDRPVIIRRLADFFDYRILSIFYDRYYLLTKQDKEENFKNRKKFSYMWNPITFSEKEQYEKKSKTKNNVVVASGRLYPQKDFESLISAWSKVPHKYDWKLRIIGEGYLWGELQKMIKKLNLEDSVELTGFSDNIIGEFSSAKIFAMTSLFEGLPLVLAEAMSLSLVPVCFDFKYGARDLIEDGCSGYIIPNRDKDEFASKLQYLIDNEAMREKMSEKARQRSRLFRLDRIMNLWKTEYEELICQTVK